MNKKATPFEKPATRRTWLRSPFLRAFAALVVVFLIGIMFNAEGAFFKWNTHRDMLRHISVFAILACGMTLVIITAGIDLSVGSLLGLTAVLFSLFTIQKTWSPWLSLPACLVIGSALGAVSGGLVGRFRIQPFIATLAMMVFARGMAKWVSGGQKISTAVLQPDGSYHYVNIPPVFNFLNSKILNENIAVVTLIFFACVLICWVILAKLRWGRHIYAIGGNEEAARLSGIPVIQTKLLTYGLSGLFCAVAGICQAAQEQQGDPEAGMTYEL
ncbi:MAG: ABC transporter permease, partial [Candidatus Aminicenantes bacterium]|nr:ABC transporter permease [Candidatus Aminicenantes bacterium]